MLIIALVLIIAFTMMLIEWKHPGQRWPHVAGWWLRAIIFNAGQMVSVFIATTTWDTWFPHLALLHAESTFNLNSTAAAFLGYFLITFIFYWWHRWRHEIPFLWRYLHQFHHSPQRIEILTTFYKHPAEILVNSFLTSVILYVLLGLTPEAASLSIMLTGLAELFYHWNVKTPYWLGFIFQRPESHHVHHKRGWHQQNFSDLPLWDMLFGTFYNPKETIERCGFADNREKKWKELLLGKNMQERS